jgi:HK97 family phage major capsid protein
LQYIATGAAAAWPTTGTESAVLFSAVAALKAGYRENARWVMNKATLFEVAAFKDSGGRYVFNPVTAPNVPPTLLGYPLVEAEDMDSKGSNKFIVAFGDFKRGYTIVDRKGMTTIRDPYSNKPYVGFYTVKRVGGKVVNSEAIKLIKCATS